MTNTESKIEKLVKDINVLQRIADSIRADIDIGAEYLKESVLNSADRAISELEGSIEEMILELGQLDSNHPLVQEFSVA